MDAVARLQTNVMRIQTQTLLARRGVLGSSTYRSWMIGETTTCPVSVTRIRMSVDRARAEGTVPEAINSMLVRVYYAAQDVRTGQR